MSGTVKTMATLGVLVVGLALGEVFGPAILWQALGLALAPLPWAVGLIVEG